MKTKVSFDCGSLPFCFRIFCMHSLDFILGLKAFLSYAEDAHCDYFQSLRSRTKRVDPLQVAQHYIEQQTDRSGLVTKYINNILVSACTSNFLCFAFLFSNTLQKTLCHKPGRIIRISGYWRIAFANRNR